MATGINLATNIAQLRKGKGVTQDELAAYLGVTKASVSKWETGQSFPDIALLPQLANYFGISIDSLMGYEPQMSKQVLVQEAARLRAAFAHEPFPVAHEACRELVREYFACSRVLVEVASIYLNHAPGAPDEAARMALLNEAVELCRRARELDATVGELRLAACVEAAAQLILGHPEETVSLLDKAEVVELGEAQLLAQANAMLGSPEKAEQILQATTYQSLLLALNALTQMALAPTCTAKRVGELHRRALSLIDAFDFDAFYDNVVSFHLSFAIAFAALGDNDAAFESLGRYAQVCERLEFPITLRGDEFFDHLDEWLADQDLNTGIPRETSLLKETLLTSVTQQPAFAALADDKRFKHIVKRLEAKFA